MLGSGSLRDGRSGGSGEGMARSGESRGDQRTNRHGFRLGLCKPLLPCLPCPPPRIRILLRGLIPVHLCLRGDVFSAGSSADRPTFEACAAGMASNRSPHDLLPWVNRLPPIPPLRSTYVTRARHNRGMCSSSRRPRV